MVTLALLGLFLGTYVPGCLGACDDFIPNFCANLASVKPDLCSVPCMATLCQRFCGNCPQKCYECHEIDDPAACNTSVECPTVDHHCVTTQSFTDDFREVYKLGCAPSLTCDQIIDPGTRRDANIKGACCQADNCNNKLPDEIHAGAAHVTTFSPTGSVQNKRSGVCADLDQSICVDLAFQLPSMCTNECIATNICPRMCAKCVQCYDCVHVSRPEDCNQTSVCQYGQSCYSLVTLSSSFDQGYRLGCLDDNTCTKFTAPSSAIGKRQTVLSGGCCKTDFCNKHGVSASTETTTTTATTTTQVLTTTSAACFSHASSSHSCPTGYTYTHNACYKIGDTDMNWSDAKEYCKRTCSGILAEFSSDVEMHAVLVDLHPVHSSSDVHAQAQVYYIGAEFTNNRWVWSSSGLTVDSHIIRVKDARHTCAYGRFDYNHFTLNEISAAHSTSCTTLLKPLCQIR